jgi:uroporphyrinogen-III decarboxylase
LIPDLIEAGFDILNPLQWTAAGMDPAEIKSTFGRQLTFWGAGIDTQYTLPFGTPEDVSREVEQLMKILGPGGGFVLSSVHNVQANVPVKNLLAMLEAFRQAVAYPFLPVTNKGKR